MPTLGPTPQISVWEHRREVGRAWVQLWGVFGVGRGWGHFGSGVSRHRMLLLNLLLHRTQQKRDEHRQGQVRRRCR